MNKKIGFISLGCAKNLTDTETMLGILSDEGYTITSDETEAEVIVVNTCAFIDSAKEESIGAILEMAEYKKDKCELLIVTGCLAQRYKDDIISDLPEVDIILGTTDYARIAEAIRAFYENGERMKCVSDENTPVSYDLPRLQSTPSYTAYLKIADGCDNFCTYCIIPKLRGKFRSRPVESIIEEAKSLADRGVKELILVAQDTACYGKDTKEASLSELLKKLSAIDGIEWIRLQYSYPENITDELIEEIASNPKVVKYLDMPIQHISDNILKKMGRKSRGDLVRSLITKLRQRVPHLTIRTSLIVGFPNETDEDFKLLTEFLSEYKLDRVGIFTYSREEGTPAAEYDGQIDEDVKKERLDIAMTIQKEVSKEVMASRVGKTDTVIVEGYDEEELCYVGRCSKDTPDVDGLAYIYSEDELMAGDIVRVEIVDSTDYDVVCRCIEN